MPITVIHGANRSGKSNLLKALFFLAQFIIYGCGEDREIPAEPCQLAPEKKNEPTSFSILFRTSKNVYQYEVSLTKREIISEKLTLFLQKEERVLYYRNTEGIHIHAYFDNRQIQSVFKSIKKNTTILTEAYKLNINFVADAYTWFKNSLKFINENMQCEYKNAIVKTTAYQEKLCYYLSKYDTGISRIFSNSQEINNSSNKTTTINLEFVHKYIEGNTAYFDFENESSGIKRLFYLLQVLVEPCENKNNSFVYIVDDVDRNLHQNLLCNFVTDFILQSSTKSCVQLIATKNNTVLIDIHLLRRDKIWITDKNSTGYTLYSVSDFKITKASQQP